MNIIEYVKVNPHLNWRWDIWRIDYDEREAIYYQGVARNEDVISYDGWIGHYLVEKGFKIADIDGNLYRFTRA